MQDDRKYANYYKGLKYFIYYTLITFLRPIKDKPVTEESYDKTVAKTSLRAENLSHASPSWTQRELNRVPLILGFLGDFSL